LNRFCFNGIYRTNRAGEFNVPFGGSRSGSLPSLKSLREASRLLKRAKLVDGDFGRTLSTVRAGDFVYLDPPYWLETRRMFREYDPNVFSEKHLNRLADHLDRLEDLRVDFVLSYADSPQARQLAKGRAMTRTIVRRNIAGFAASRRRSVELIVTPRYTKAR
jgi:DNA adenine methylase